MPCVDNQRDTIIRATQIFEQRCLPEFFVASVEAQKYPGNVPCRWRVTYKYIDPNCQYEGGEYAKRLVRKFDAVKPESTNIMKPAIGLITVINNDPCYVIRYCIICECVSTPLFFPKFTCYVHSVLYL
jgi:hypothetical protein